MKVWERLGFPSQQHYAARCRVNKRRISAINARLEELGWFDGKPSKEGDALDEERGRLVSQTCWPLLDAWCGWHTAEPGEPRCEELTRGYVRVKGTGQILPSCEHHLKVATTISHGYDVLERT